MGERVSAGNCVRRVFVGVSDQPGARLTIISEMSEVVETREGIARTRERKTKQKNRRPCLSSPASLLHLVN